MVGRADRRARPVRAHRHGLILGLAGRNPPQNGPVLPLQPPIAPMLAKSADEVPDGGGWRFEPKWDGFRCLAFWDGRDVVLQGRGRSKDGGMVDLAYAYIDPRVRLG